MIPKGILWHSTGANNPNLKRYIQPSDNAKDKNDMLELLGINNNKNDWNHIVRQAGVNAWIGKLKDGSVAAVQTLPWNYRPWGCGSGAKGSCNNGWIQFEICEDNLSDKNYFNKIYTEACELTAYLCELYKIDPNGTVSVNGVKVPTILCHADAHELGFGSNHADIYHWFKKHGKDMEDVRNDVSKLLKPTVVEKPVVKETYRVRKTWEDAKSQVGAYTSLDNAKDACDKAGKGFEVYNSKGIAIYPESSVVTEENSKISSPFKVGDAVKIITGAKYVGGKDIPNWLIKTKVYVREIKKNGDIAFSTGKTGAITGVTSAKNLTPYTSSTTKAVDNKGFTPYIIRVNTGALNVRAGAGNGYKITKVIYKNETHTIVDEKSGWGKLKNGNGWIYLAYTKKI